MSDLIVVSAKECEGLRWQPPRDVSFAARLRLLPLHAGELTGAVTSMPMAFGREEGRWRLFGVCGRARSENLFVRDGNWLGAYRPQCLSDWPFGLKKIRDRAILTFDKGSGLIVEDDGEPFFLDDGTPAPALAEIRERLQAVAGKIWSTERAVEALYEKGVLQSWPDAVSAGGAGFDSSGLFLLNEQALAKLGDADFLELRRAGALAVGYAVNLSLGQTHLLERLARLAPSSSATGEIDDLEAFFEDDDSLSF